MENPVQQKTNTSLQLMRTVSAGVAGLYLIFGLLQHFLGVTDLVPWSHRLFFAGVSSILVIASYISNLVAKHMHSFVYCLGVVATLHLVSTGLYTIWDPGAVVALLLIIPTMNLLFYRWETLLSANALLLVIILAVFSIRSPSLMENLMFIIFSISLSGASYWFMKRLRLTEQKHARLSNDLKRSLQESELKYRSLVENASDIIYSLTPEGVFTYVSPNWTTLVGHDRNNVEGHPFELFVHPEDVHLCAMFQEKAVATGEKQSGLEYRVRQKNGDWLWLMSNGAPQYDSNGNVSAYIGIARDITARKKAEERLQKKTEELDGYFTQSLDLLCIANTAGKFVRLNPEWQRVLGYSLTDLEERSFLEFVHPDDTKSTQSALEKLDSQEEVLNFENRYHCKDGSYCWIEWRAKAQGDLIHAVGRDITSRKEAENALYEQAQRQEFAAQLAFNFLNEDLHHINQKVDEALAIVGKIMNADRCYIYIFSDLNNTISKKLEWCAEGIPSHRDDINTNPVTTIPWLHEQLINHKTVIVSSLSEIPQDAIDKDMFEQHAIKSFFCVPMITQGTVMGFMGISYVQAEHEISYNDTLTLHIAGGIIAGAIERGRAEQELTYLTFHDHVTGLYNRTFFEEQLKRLDAERMLPITLIMGDVNGLKIVNDAYGHLQGDELLRTIAAILLECCRSEDIIARWGGDEFVILLTNTADDISQQICTRIRSACDNAADDPIKPSISLGYAVKTETTQNIQDVLKEAEDRMYRNKLISAQSNRNALINSMQRTLEKKSHETREHSRKLQHLSLKLAKQIGMSEADLDNLSLLALLHDLGKVAIPDHILNKPDSLSPSEWDIIKRHPEIGYRIAITSPELAAIAEYILAHHEHWDGSGYPRGLKGETIPYLARILSVVDAYDAMINGRPYRKRISQEKALETIRSCAGSQFDPAIVDAFIHMLTKKDF